MNYYFTSLFTIKYAEMSVLQNHFCFSFWMIDLDWKEFENLTT